MAFIGLRNFVVAKIESDTDEGTKYSEIKKLKGARVASMSPQVAEGGGLYGDDQLLENESSLTSIDVSIELASLSLEDEAFLKGGTYEGGVYKENKDDSAPEIALGFMAPKSKTGGGGFRMVWLVKGTASAGTDEEFNTKEDSIEYGTPTMDFTFTPRLSDGELRFKADTNEEGAPNESAFFTVEFLQKGSVTA